MILTKNKIVNRFYYQEINSSLKYIKDSPDLPIVLVDHLLKTKTKDKNLKNPRKSRYIYQNELDTACFQHYMAYRNFKDLLRGTASAEVLLDKAFNNAKNLKYDGYQSGLASIVYKFSINSLQVGL